MGVEEISLNNARLMPRSPLAAFFTAVQFFFPQLLKKALGGGLGTRLGMEHRSQASPLRVGRNVSEQSNKHGGLGTRPLVMLDSFPVHKRVGLCALGTRLLVMHVVKGLKSVWLTVKPPKS